MDRDLPSHAGCCPQSWCAEAQPRQFPGRVHGRFAYGGLELPAHEPRHSRQHDGTDVEAISGSGGDRAISRGGHLRRNQRYPAWSFSGRNHQQSGTDGSILREPTESILCSRKSRPSTRTRDASFRRCGGLDERIAALAREKQVPLADYYSALWLHPDAFSDGVHLKRRGYLRMEWALLRVDRPF